VEKIQKEIEIRIIISYYSIFILIDLINLFGGGGNYTPSYHILSYIILNRRIETGKKETENNFKKFSNIFKYHIIHFYKTLIYFLL